MIWNDDDGTISYLTCDRVHSADLAEIIAAWHSMHETCKPGPCPFSAITVERDLSEWASSAHAPLLDLTDAIDEWCSWIDEVCEQAAEAGDDTTDNAREICGYLFAEEIPDDDTPVSRAVGRALRAGEACE